MSKLIPIKYHEKNYPPRIKCTIQETAGNFDKEKIVVNSEYSLHTEYSYMPRSLDSKIVHDLFQITAAHKDNIPKLWYDKDWANEFFIFIDRLIATNNSPKVLEIHPPFKEYCDSFMQFLDVFKVFYDKYKNKYPQTIILIENRCGTMYKGGKFLLSTCSDILNFCEILKNSNIDLKIVLDYPQIFSAELIKMDNVNLKKILSFNSELTKYKDIIGGFHMWGKRKSEKGRWTPHTGDLNTFFSNNNDLKHQFLTSILNTFNDDIERYFVPEVNSGEEDLISIVNDMEQEGFIFISENNLNYQLIRIKWENEQPFFELYNRNTGEIVYKQVLGNNSINIYPIKYCLGSYELGTHKYIPCKNDVIMQGQKICKECENLNGFKYCISCRGEKCVAFNYNAIEYCNQKHFVYLAYFSDKIIKVGTAHELRKEERLVEQGSLYRILIAEVPTGKLARQIENEISKLGYKSSVSSTHKIQNLLFSETEDDIHERLCFAYEHIEQNLKNKFKKYLLNPCIYYSSSYIAEILSNTLKQTENQQLSLFDDIFNPQYNIISNISDINGEIMALIGSIALFKDNKNNVCAYDFKEIYGSNISFN